MWLADGEKFDAVDEWDGQTDRRTDGQQPTVLACSASRRAVKREINTTSFVCGLIAKLFLNITSIERKSENGDKT